MEQPLVSIIVSTKNSENFMDAFLSSAKQQSYPNIELIVVDNNSTDHTKEISAKYTDKIFNKGPERSAQRNYGVAQSQGEYVLICDCDMELTKDVVAECVKVVKENNDIKAVIIPEQSFGIGFWAKCKALERSCYVGDDTMEAARFFNRKAFDEFNGYDEENTGTEDYDLPFRMRKRYPVQGRISAVIMHNEGNFKVWRSMKKKYYYAQKLKKYKSVHPEMLKKQAVLIRPAFIRNWRKIFKSPVLGIGMIIMKSCEMGAGAVGYLKSNK